MTALKDYQFEILPSVDAADGFVFGIGADVSLNDGGWDPGAAEELVQDGQNTRRGTRSFGRDVRGAATWLWESHVNRTDEYEATDTLDAFSAAWDPDEKEDPAWVTSVRYRLAGRDRRVFGRPRRFSAPMSNMVLGGFVPVTHDFACVDSLTYDDLEQSRTIPFSSSAEGGGFILPTSFPVMTQASEESGLDQIQVGGTARCYPVIRFQGPWTNPGLRSDTGWEVHWTGGLNASEWVEIDARPWALTVLDQSGASRVEGLGRRTYFEDMWFPPNTQPRFTLSGSAPGGGATAQIRWRAAWKSL